MSTTTIIATTRGTNAEVRAAKDALAVQDAVNIMAIVGSLHEHLLALHRADIHGCNLIAHPVTRAYISKLRDLSRLSLDHELNALGALEAIADGQVVEYETFEL